MASEPLSEPPTATGSIAAVRAAAEVALPAIRALLDDPGRLPQQALGELNVVAKLINQVLVNLQDSQNFAKYRRLNRAILKKKKFPKAPEQAEAVFRAAGFRETEDTEHIEWGPEEEALAPALAVLALNSRAQERAGRGQASGYRARAEPLDANVGAKDILALSYGNALLLEPREGAVGGSGNTIQTATSVKDPLVSRMWLRERLPTFVSAMEEFRALFEPGTREKALSRAVGRCIGEARAAQCPQDSAKLTASPILNEVAQLAASGALVNLRRPGILFTPAVASSATAAASAASGPAPLSDLAASAEAEPDGEPSVCEALAVPPSEKEMDTEETTEKLACTSLEPQKVLFCPGPPPPGRSPYLTRPPTGAGSPGQIVPVLLDCVPCFRLGLPHATLSDIVGMREAPAFFTQGVHEKPFEVSVKALAEHVVAQWLKKPELAAALLRSETSTVGVGCSLDIGNDDKAIVIAVIA